MSPDKGQIEIAGIPVSFHGDEGDDKFVSLTSLARRASGEPDDVIRNWLRSRNTLDYLAAWERLNNPDFNSVEFDGISQEAGRNRFTMSPKRWVEATNAKGIHSKGGRYGGVYAHWDIAIEFASWLSADFKLLLIREFQRLKADERAVLDSGWDERRVLASMNYRVHTDAIRDHIIPASALPPAKHGMIYAQEAELINMLVFGTTAAEWAAANPEAKGNIRDHADVLALLLVTNLESLNATFIRQGHPQAKRAEMLAAEVSAQRVSLAKSLGAKAAVKRLK